MNLHRRLHEEALTGSVEFGRRHVGEGPISEFPDKHCGWLWLIPLATAAISGAASYAAAKQNAKAQQAAINAQQPAIDAALRGQALAQAAADPSNPLNANLTRILEAAMRENVLRGLREAFAADRRLTRRSGRAGVFLNPERRDETRSRAVLEAFSGIGSKAREEAANRLISAGTGNINASRALTGPLSNVALGELVGGQNRADTTQGLAALFGKTLSNPDVSNALNTYFSGSGPVTSSPATTNALQAFNRGSIYEAL